MSAEPSDTPQNTLPDTDTLKNEIREASEKYNAGLKPERDANAMWLAGIQLAVSNRATRGLQRDLQNPEMLDKEGAAARRIAVVLRDVFPL